jgi:hypothetical protein
MAHITQRQETASPHRRPGFVMTILLAAAFAIIGLSVLTWPSSPIGETTVQQATMPEADAAGNTAATPRREDWHGNYNMVRR